MKLKGHALGLALGIIWGGAVFLATIWLVIKGGVLVGPTLAKLGIFYWGYTVTYMGSIVGLIYGFLDGYITGLIIAFIYNRFSGDDE